MGLGVLGVTASRALLPQAPESPAVASVNVTQHHNNPSRDGLFIDPAFTMAAAANLTRDLNFNGTIVGNVYSQPLYVEGGPSGPVVIATTESNNVYALNATNGAIVWQRNVGTPAPGMGLITGGVGITGTPVIDLASRSLILVAVISGPNNMIYSLNVDTGAINPGFPIDVNASFPDFSSSLHMQRGALMLLGNMVYVPYGGYADGGNYHGRVLGVSLDGTQLGSWVATSLKSGIWNPGGIASDGTNLFVVTGNAPPGTTPWGGSEAVIRLQPGPVFSGSTADFWAPTNWQSLDSGDVDLGGSNAIILDVPGATPSALVVAIGKDRNGYLLNRANLGGISAPIAQGMVAPGQVINSAATYRTSQGTFVVLRSSNIVTAFKITPTSPPTIATGWTANSTGRTSPFVTSTDGTNNPIVWAYVNGTNQRLFGFNGETGAVIFAGGGANDTISGFTRTFNTGIVARGRIYIAGDNKVYAFSVPTGATPTPSPTATPTAAPTATPTPTATPVVTPTATASPTPVITPTATPIATPSVTPIITPTATPGTTPTATPIVTPTGTPGATPTPGPATPTPTPSATASPASQPLNLSTRMFVQSGDNAGIGGFIISGSAPKHVLVRVIGPSLTQFGVANALADPVLELHGPSPFATVNNDNWGDDPAQQAAILATGLAPTNNLESAIEVTLNPGAYTAVARGKNNGTGVGLIEVFDLSQAVLAKLANISTRAFVNTGKDVVIAGFILGNSNGSTRIVLRGIGGSLTVFGVPNALANPTLELRDSNAALVASNDDWQSDPAQAAELTAAGSRPDQCTGVWPGDNARARPYTALLAGQGNTTGVGIIEVYDRGAP